jgi:hypothetical protein
MIAAAVAAALGDASREGKAWRCRCPLHGGHANFISEVAVALQGEGKIKTAVEISARDTAVTACILLQQGGSPKILHSVLTPNGDGRALGLLDILLFEEMS